MSGSEGDVVVTSVGIVRCPPLAREVFVGLRGALGEKS